MSPIWSWFLGTCSGPKDTNKERKTERSTTLINRTAITHPPTLPFNPITQPLLKSPHPIPIPILAFPLTSPQAISSVAHTFISVFPCMHPINPRHCIAQGQEYTSAFHCTQIAVFLLATMYSINSPARSLRATQKKDIDLQQRTRLGLCCHLHYASYCYVP